MDFSTVAEKTKCKSKVIVSVMKWYIFSNLIAVVQNAVFSAGFIT